MTELIRINNQNTGLADPNQLGEAMDAAATANIFTNYLVLKSENTKKRHERELNLFGQFLNSIGLLNNGMTTPEQWTGITFGMIEGYRNHMIKSGYSVNTINQTISIIKLYARLAGQAKYIPAEALLYIENIKGYKSSDGKHLDENRKAEQISTRRTQSKKETNTRISRYQAEQLKHGQRSTLEGYRNAMLMTILLDHGARVSEVIGLTFGSVNLDMNEITFYRSKVNRTDKHNLSADSRTAVINYLEALQDKGITLSPNDSLFVGINKGGKVSGTYSIRAAQSTVKQLGESIGLANLSPHDCRHYFATSAKRGGTDSLDIMRAGGWNTMTMVNRYIDKESISNTNVKLG